VDHRPSDLDPYPRTGRDLAAGEVWQQSLERSRQRRRLERASRSHRQRRKGTSLAVGAAMLASPVMPAFAGKGGGRAGGAGPAAVDTSSLSAATGGRTELLRFGDVGPAVASIQRQVGVDDDGIFGPITQAGVQRFQRAHGLGVTGIVDARTWATLFNGRVLFYDQSGDRGGAPSLTADVRLVVDDDDQDGDGGPGSPEGTGSAPATTSAPGTSESPPSDGTSSDDSGEPETPEPRRSRPAPPPPPAPQPVAPPTQAPAGGCTDGRVSAPVQGTVTGRFGEGRGDHSHSGLDLAAPSGTPIHAVQCGTVVQSGSDSGYGLMVCVRHAGGVTTCYAHMSRTQASVEQQVGAGQVIGYVGCTGSCTGPHVHVEVRRNGRAEDPAPYLAGQQTIAGATATAASTRRTPTTSAGTSRSSMARAAVQTGASPAPAAAPAATPAPAVAQGAQPADAAAAQPAAAPAPAPPAAPSDQAAPAPEPAPTPTPAPAEAPTDAAPAPAPEQSAPEQSLPEPAAPTEQSAPAPAPESAPAPTPAPAEAPAEATPAPAPQQSAPEPAPEQSAPEPAREQSAPEPTPERSAPEPTPAPEQSAPDLAPAPEPTPAPQQSAPEPAPTPDAAPIAA
jgi:peptidoglycan hydrolase-like protein with peptidoglycan-binding domain